MSFVRTSKFRHVFGRPAKTESCFLSLKTEGSGDTNCAVSCKFFALVKNAKIFVVAIDNPGRHEENTTPYIDCKSKVLDVAWSPFNDYILASAEESGDINIWNIPEEGIESTTTIPYLELHGVHTRKVTNLLWHPTADYVLAATGHDQFVSVWDCLNQEVIVEIPAGEMPTNIAFNTDGSLMAITTKENKVMSLSVVDPRTGNCLIKKEEAHQGFKPTKCVFLKNGNVITFGSDKQANRSICLWKGDDLSLLAETEVSNSSAVQNIYYDSDLQILYTHGKGESVIKYFEVNENDGEIFYLSTYTGTSSQKGGNFMPKRGVNPSLVEIARYYRLQTNKCEPVSFIVPRKSEHFQTDLYPSCASDEPALTCVEWISGLNRPPCQKEFTLVRSGAAKKEPKKAIGPAQKKAPPPSSRCEAKSAAAQESSTANGVPDGIDFTELLEDMKKVKATVRKLNKRVAKLEEMLEQQQDAEEEEE